MQNGPGNIDLHVFRTRHGARAVRITYDGLERPLYFMPHDASPYLDDLLRELAKTIERYRWGEGASNASALAQALGDIDGTVPWAQCPGCGAWEPDFDGVGVLFHLTGIEQLGCGYCSHPSKSGGVCDVCPTAGPQVHVLHHGRPLCRFANVVPAEWPQGHTWVAVSAVEEATCAACRRAAVRMGDQVALRPPSGLDWR